jgi:hypothetical protein
LIGLTHLTGLDQAFSRKLKAERCIGQKHGPFDFSALLIFLPPSDHGHFADAQVLAQFGGGLVGSQHQAHGLLPELLVVSFGVIATHHFILSVLLPSCPLFRGKLSDWP